MAPVPRFLMLSAMLISSVLADDTTASNDTALTNETATSGANETGDGGGSIGIGEKLGPDAEVYTRCALETYYAPLLAKSSNPADWTLDDIRDFYVDSGKQEASVLFQAEREGQEDVTEALINLWQSNISTAREPYIHLVYANSPMKSRPAGNLANWVPDWVWPPIRGSRKGTPAYTDLFNSIPVDYSIRDAKKRLNPKRPVFFGECKTVSQNACKRPDEAAEDCMTDTKIFLPPANVRGPIARMAFYNFFRYKWMILADCPPFNLETDFGYKSALLKWSLEHPVDEAEKLRNERICKRWQGNRNIAVDYPEIIPKVLGDPDSVQPGTLLYSKCIDDTEAPTATPNECSAIQPGDIWIHALNSNRPDGDQLVITPLDYIPADVGSLYVTNKAWDGKKFIDGSGGEIEVCCVCLVVLFCNLVCACRWKKYGQSNPLTPFFFLHIVLAQRQRTQGWCFVWLQH